MSSDELTQYTRLSDGRYYYTTPKGDYTDESIQRLDAEDRIERTRNDIVRVRHFLPRDKKGAVGREKQLPDVWSDTPSLGHAGGKEKVGFPTQKPLSIYERMIRANSREGDMVLDPFAGCTTTLVAAERLKRQWVGIDIWDNAKAVVLQRLERERMIDPQSTDRQHGHLFVDDITFASDPPVRTDTGELAAPNLRTKVTVFEPRGPKMTRDEMYKLLLGQKGCKCQGCDRTFDDPRYLELDHNTPRSDNGINHISNRILLCGPCNRIKSNTLTLTGLRRKNKKLGYMHGSGRENPIMKEISETKKKAPPLFE